MNNSNIKIYLPLFFLNLKEESIKKKISTTKLCYMEFWIRLR